MLFLFQTRKAPGALYPAVVLPPLRVQNIITVPQGTSPSLCSERRDEPLFGQAKTRGLGQVTMKKKTKQKKWVLLHPVLMAG